MIWIEWDKSGEEPVSLGEVKRFLRLERDDEDAIVARCISAAREAVEAQTGLVLTERRLRLSFEPDPARDRLALHRRPLRDVAEAIGYDEAGAAVPLEPASFRLDPQPFGAWLQLPAGLAARAPNGVELELRAGEAPDDVPEALKLAIVRLAGAAFETRGAVSPALQPAFMPPLARALIAPFRTPRL
ncbi:head-tail connector protein [Aureimonas ureilytica]|uniref:head-tail connector protein n=1 Tax=Aureimonas ureilytica TaxID=401562 RepID=UPI003CF0B48F